MRGILRGQNATITGVAVLAVTDATDAALMAVKLTFATVV